MHRPLLAVLLGGVLVLSAPARAQDVSQEPDAPQARSPLHTGIPPRDQGDGPATADAVLWHAEDLLGRTIRNGQGDNLGSIDDLVLDARQGTIHALVDVGGVLGVGEERVAISLSEMTVADDGALVLDATPSQLAARPQYRFPESPLTGAIRPGRQVPQAAAGTGAPNQGSQFEPGIASRGEDAREPMQGPPDRVSPTPLGQAVRGGPESAGDSVDYARRDDYFREASQQIDALARRLNAQPLGDDARARLAEQHAEAANRLDSLRSASPEAWPTALSNFRISLARLEQNTQQAEATGTAQPPAPRPAD
ncbi:PRC-barrel domain-containing protein [Novispirillum sp. DQ9]|uniref:PRC-barrel domain-containing protein n=1 Tax=Novispirillum sp. DQ9 TaxID=3398612 RepID=UPI003C7B9275